MAITKEIIITSNMDDVAKDADRLAGSLDKVSGEGKKAAKSVDDVAGNGGAIAILDSVTGGLATKMKDTYEATKLFNGSLKVTKTALIATGIGLFVIALGAVVAYWDDIEEAINGTNKKLQEQLDLSIKIQDSIRLQLSLAEKQLTLAEKQGVATDALRRQRLEILNTLRKENDQEIKLLEIQAAKLKSAAFELTTREKILKTVLNTLKAGSGDAFILDQQVEAANQYKELQDAITKAKEEQVDLDIKLFDINNPKGTDKKEETDNTKIGFDDSVQKRIEEEIKAIEELARIRQEFADKARENEIVQNEVDRDRKLLEIENLVADEVFKREAIAEVNKFYDQQAIDLAAEKAKKESEIEKEKNEKIKKDEEALRNAKFAIANQTLNVLGGLAKEGSGLAKGIAASQATINTFQGITSALSATSVIPDPFGTILKFANAAAIGVAGFINVKKILATKPVSTSASGGADAGSGAGAPPAPSFNLVQGTGSNQIADSLQMGNQPLKAYVVSSDVSSSQEMDRNIEGNATL